MPHHRYVGIDPGKEGALALVDVEFPGTAQIRDTPTLQAKGGTKRTYDEVAMARVLRELSAGSERGIVLVVIEKVHSMPAQGVSTTFALGMGYGIWLGIIATLELPHVRVDPRTWKKLVLVDVDKEDDAAVAAAAGRAYPTAAGDLRTPRGRVLDGRADALLLAHYGRTAGL